MKTREEVEALKRNWLHDPCYDLVPTDEDWKEHEQELAEFQAETQERWRRQERNRLTEKAAKLKASVPMVQAIEALGAKIERLERMLAN